MRVNTAYAFQLYEMLRQKGLNKGDYEVKPVGGTGQRLEAMAKDKTYAAAMMNPPFSIRAEKAGLKAIDYRGERARRVSGLDRLRAAHMGRGEFGCARQIPARLHRGAALDARSEEQGRRRSGCWSSG